MTHTTLPLLLLFSTVAIAAPYEMGNGAVRASKEMVRDENGTPIGVKVKS